MSKATKQETTGNSAVELDNDLDNSAALDTLVGDETEPGEDVLEEVLDEIEAEIDAEQGLDAE